jgi:hypothetical protein
MQISPAQNGFLKGLGLAVLFAFLSYISDTSHLAPVVSGGVAMLITSLASSLESYLRDKHAVGLLGLVNVRQ